MGELQFMRDVFPIGMPVIGLVVWLIRLEGKTNYAARGLEKLETRHEALESKIVEKLSVIEKSIAKIEGWLSIENQRSGK